MVDGDQLGAGAARLGHDVLTGRDAGDPVTHRPHSTGHLEADPVRPHVPVGAGRDISPLAHQQVGAVQPCGGDLHQHLVRGDGGRRDLGHGPRGWCAGGQECTHGAIVADRPSAK